MRAHVRTCHVHKLSKILLLYLENQWADRAQLWSARRDSPAMRFAIVKSGCIRTCARATCTNTTEIPLLYLDNHSANRAQIWYIHSDPSTKGCALAKSWTHPHVRTCHVHNPQNLIAISRQPLDRSCSNLVLTLRFIS